MNTTTALISPSTLVSETEYREISDFLYDEADLLSAMDYKPWGKLLADDIHYVIPVTQFFEMGKERKIGIGNPYFDEDIHSMKIRIKLLSTASMTTAENPRSALSLMVGNIRAEKAGDNEYRVKSRILLSRVRASESQPYELAGRREDLLRRHGGGLLLARRTVYLNQSIIKTHNLSFFL